MQMKGWKLIDHELVIGIMEKIKFDKIYLEFRKTLL